MAFITMPAPKIGAKFYDKPGSRRTLFVLKRLQDNMVVCTPADDTGKESLTMPIEAWEKLTGYTVGPDLLALMTFSPPEPAPAVAEPAKAKPAKASKPAAKKTTKATEAPAAPAAAPTAITQDFARKLVTLLKGQAVWMRLSGPSNAEARQEILRELTGVKPPKNKAGINTVERVLCEKLGIDEKAMTYRDRDHLLTARLQEIAGDSNTAPAPAAPAPQLAPAEIVMVSDGVELVVQPLRAATPAEVATAAIVKPEVPTDAQPLVIKIGQIIWPNGNPGDLTQIDPPRLQAMVANIKARKVQENGEIVVEQCSPDLTCVSGESQDEPIAQYKLVAGHEQLQAIRYFLEQNGAPGPIDNYQIRVMFTKPAEPALTDQPEEPDALGAEDYDEQGRLRPSAMNKKQVAAAIAELVADGWRLVERKEMGIRHMRLVHDERGLATIETVNERGLVRGTRLTGMYRPSEAYYREWLASAEPAPAEPAPAEPAPVRYAWQNTITNVNDLERRKRKLGKEAAALDEQDSVACQVITDEIEAIDRELESRQRGATPAILNEEEMLRELQERTSHNVQIAYNGKIIDMGNVTNTTHGSGRISKNQEKEQFRAGAMRIYDNLGTVTGFHTGYVKTPTGKYYTVTRDARMAKPFVPPALAAPAAAPDMWQKAADEGSDAAKLVEVIAQDGAAWWEGETAKAAVADAAIQPAVEAQQSIRIDVPVNQFTYNDNSWDVPDSKLNPIMLNLGEYGPQATDITACASGLHPGKYLVVTGAEYIAAAVKLKWETVPITLVEMPCEPIIEEYRAEYVGHNADGQALYADKHGVRTIRKRNGIAVTEPVHLIPTYGGIEYGVDRTYRPEYKTRAELEEEQGKVTAVAAAAAEPVIEAPAATEPVQAAAEPAVEKVLDEAVMPNHTAFHIGHNQNGKALYQATNGRRYYGWDEKTREWFREPQRRRQDPDTGLIVYETCRQQHTNFLTREELAQNPLPDEKPVTIPEFHDINARTTDRELASRLKNVDKKDKQLSARMNGAYELAINDGGASMRRIENEMRIVDFERDAIRNEQTRRLNAAKTAAARAAAAAPAPIQEIAAANPGRIIIAGIPSHTDPVDKPATVASVNPPGVLIDRVTLPAKAPAPTNEPLTQQIQVMGVGDQITEAGAAMLDEPQPKVHYDPNKVDLLFGLYPPKSYSAHHLVLLGDCTNLTFAPNRQQQLHVITAMLEQIGVNVTTLGAAPALVTTGRSVLATTGAQGIIGYQNDADYLNGEANRFNRTSGLIEANQFLTWRCNLEGFWRIHIAYDASDAYTVRMWRALDPLVSKALGEVVAEEKQVYLDDLHGVVEEMYYDCLKRFGYNGTPKWTPAINPNIPTASSRPAPRRRH